MNHEKVFCEHCIWCSKPKLTGPDNSLIFYCYYGKKRIDTPYKTTSPSINSANSKNDCSFYERKTDDQIESEMVSRISKQLKKEQAEKDSRMPYSVLDIDWSLW